MEAQRHHGMREVDVVEPGTQGEIGFVDESGQDRDQKAPRDRARASPCALAESAFDHDDRQESHRGVQDQQAELGSNHDIGDQEDDDLRVGCRCEGRGPSVGVSANRRELREVGGEAAGDVGDREYDIERSATESVSEAMLDDPGSGRRGHEQEKRCPLVATHPTVTSKEEQPVGGALNGESHVRRGVHGVRHENTAEREGCGAHDQPSLRPR
jgi:hypothetical protein